MELKILLKVFSENNSGIVFEKSSHAIQVPNVGDKVYDPLFPELKEVKQIIYNYNCKYIFIILDKKEVEDKELEGPIQEKAKETNWEVSKSVIK
ncbi:hypothetical protein CI105_06105 [Candidatus Izimaplasma bacterium ZiA1]|uniref:hypothetical protein n=1 Tax=Candidatus Izimoplasma sp. ZiA1 TaxID=2024899 RepID=UPI000BAA8588|nr:hypothetical protein CI105_06105 [Candidatus Izimaplasma bacterium ZiA1]